MSCRFPGMLLFPSLFRFRSAIRSRDISSHLCPLRGRYNAAPRGAAEPERGYFIAAINARQALTGTLSVSPLRFLVSRTITASAALPTSTHSPPFAPEAPALPHFPPLSTPPH